MSCLLSLRRIMRSRDHRSEAPVSNKECDKLDNLLVRSCVSASSSSTMQDLYEEKASNLRVFTFNELSRATGDFRIMSKVGRGGFGYVYKGIVRPADGRGDAIVVAIKKLNQDSFQGHKQWMTEIQFLSLVEHPNLVNLIGYCAVDRGKEIQRLLVYEFLPNGTLYDHLFKEEYPSLPWKARLQIALGAAQGLAYLHEELEIQVIYRDFKASNVLLDNEFNPKLSDFGLAREGPPVGQTHVSASIMGTHGYAAPDYVETGHLTTKSDVWSFGVVLYEMLTGRQTLEKRRPKMEQKLLEWVQHFPADSPKFNLIMDLRLGGRYPVSCARDVAKLADTCLSKRSRDRPNMREVAERLRQVIHESNRCDGPSETITEVSAQIPTHESQVSESACRRMEQLLKLGTHAGGASTRGLMIMHKNGKRI